MSDRKWSTVSYYQTTRDVSTNFFFDYLPVGDYVFTYDVTIQQRGNLAGGLASLESMYAPKMALHTEGVRLKVE